MDKISVGDHLLYTKNFAITSDGVGIVVRKIEIGQSAIVSSREMRLLVTAMVLPKQVLIAKIKFEPTRARLRSVILLIAKENDASVEYTLIIKKIQYTDPYSKARKFNCNKMDKEARERRSVIAKNNYKINVKKERARAIASEKRRKTAIEKGGESWSDIKDRLEDEKEGLAASRRLHKLIKRSQEISLGK